MSSYGYDMFVIDDNYYTDSFYNDMSNSLAPQEEKKNTPTANTVSSFSNYKQGCRCKNMQRLMYSKAEELNEIKSQVFTLYLLLIVSVFIIVSQRITINGLNNLLYVIKLSSRGPTSQTPIV